MLPFADDPVDPAQTTLLTSSEACFVGDDSKGTLCRWVYDRTDNEWLAQSSDWLIAKPIRIVLILLVALLVRRVVHTAIARAADRLADGTPHPTLGRGRSEHGRAGPAANGGTLAAERRQQRAATMSSVLRSVATGVFLTVAFLMVGTAKSRTRP